MSGQMLELAEGWVKVGMKVTVVVGVGVER